MTYKKSVHEEAITIALQLNEVIRSSDFPYYSLSLYADSVLGLKNMNNLMPSTIKLEDSLDESLFVVVGKIPSGKKIFYLVGKESLDGNLDLYLCLTKDKDMLKIKNFVTGELLPFLQKKRILTEEACFDSLVGGIPVDIDCFYVLLQYFMAIGCKAASGSILIWRLVFLPVFFYFFDVSLKIRGV
ncbi:MAG TPA: hypothetical protein PKD96_01180 [Candidatus Absconditabacterales bacterium]|nr:hypothetical protein [Candidatus Absconditabacterales bacterium]HMT26893.1 hypothetical protein [Candidatus Absconditabacterales bacterium]